MELIADVKRYRIREQPFAIEVTDPFRPKLSLRLHMVRNDYRAPNCRFTPDIARR